MPFQKGPVRNMQFDQATSGGAFEKLCAFIDQGQFCPGDRLPPERVLIEELKLSRASLRNALKKLEDSGTIWRHVGKGTFLGPQAISQQDANPVLTLARRTAPIKMMKARLAVEPGIAREAALNGSVEALDKIAAAQNATLEAGDWDSYEAADDDFHRAIAGASDNLPLVAIFDQLNLIRRSVAWENVMRVNARPPPDHGSFQEHAVIAAALTAHDAEAAEQAMRSHLKAVSRRLFGEF